MYLKNIKTYIFTYSVNYISKIIILIKSKKFNSIALYALLNIKKEIFRPYYMNILNRNIINYKNQLTTSINSQT